MTKPDQQAFWNGDAGGTWVAQQEAFDALMQPVLDTLWQKAALGPGASVLDIGCGTGVSVLQAARQVGPEGHVTGVDISEPMLTLAATRTRDMQNVTLMQADAAAHDFDGAGFDHLISRFGVMFFGDTTAAFAHILKSLKPGARVTFATWARLNTTRGSRCPPRPRRQCWARRLRLIRTTPAPLPCATAQGPLRCSVLQGLWRSPWTRKTCILRPQAHCRMPPPLLSARGRPNGPWIISTPAQRTARRSPPCCPNCLPPLKRPQGLRIPAEINYFSARAPL